MSPWSWWQTQSGHRAGRLPPPRSCNSFRILLCHLDTDPHRVQVGRQRPAAPHPRPVRRRLLSLRLLPRAGAAGGAGRRNDGLTRPPPRPGNTPSRPGRPTPPALNRMLAGCSRRGKRRSGDSNSHYRAISRGWPAKAFAPAARARRRALKHCGSPLPHEVWVKDDGLWRTLDQLVSGILVPCPKCGWEDGHPERKWDCSARPIVKGGLV